MEETCAAGASCAAAFTRVDLMHRAVALVMSLWAHVRRQLSNDFIGGSLALATASFLSNLTWRIGRHARRIAHDRVFTTYDIPSGTPQYHAALRWLHSQPAVQRASRRLVVNPAGARAAKDTGANDPDDPLELGLRTLPMLARDQSVCVRVGGALVWAGHGHVAGSAADSAAATFDGHGALGAMGGGGARGSWYSQLLAGARGHAGLASSAQSGAEAFSVSPGAPALDDGLIGLEGGVDAIDGGCGFSGGAALRLRVLARNPRAAVKAVLARGRELGRGTARRHTQVYMPSTAMSPAAAAMRAGAYAGDFSSPRAASGVGSDARGGADAAGSGFFAYGAGARPEWVDAGRRPARPVESVVLKGDAARAIVDDARAFLRLERWYAERGIPYRRGYLLHGAPGSGKTSLVRAVAGELRLPVYQLPLSGAGVDDEAFHRLLNSAARRSVVLLEDVDAGVGTSGRETVATVAGLAGREEPIGGATNGIGCGLTLRGLLGALDGVGAAEGRLLFMTCRDASVLEPALIRPGRIDARLAFEAPDAAQAKALFRRFYGLNEDEDARRERAKDAETARARKRVDDDDETTRASALAEAFAAAATDPRLASRDHPAVSSMAALQGVLVSHRDDPRGAVEAVSRILEAATSSGVVA